MTIQTVFFMFGIILIIAAVGLGIAAVVYFRRMDIRSVQADLSGKARQAGIASISFASAKTKNKQGALAKDPVWQGGIAKGDLKKHQTSQSITDSSGVAKTKAVTDSEANASEPVDNDAKTVSDSSVSETRVSETCVAVQGANERTAQAEQESEVKTKASQVRAEETPRPQAHVMDDKTALSKPCLFLIEQSVVCLGSSVVLDIEGKLKEVDSVGRAVEK